jgi:hypothetical protein
MTRYLFLCIIVLLINCEPSQRSDQSSGNKTSDDSVSSIENSVDTLQTNSIQKANDEKTDFQLKELASTFKNFQLFRLNETITEDLNGDHVIDKATFTSQNGKSGILITDGKTKQEIKIGLGVGFEEIGDDFSWVDYWAVVKDSTTYEVMIRDSEIIGDTIVRLENPSIAVRKEEVGGGLIIFRKGKYEWIHQAD